MRNYPFSFRYYLFRPWRFIEATLKNIKYAGQRAFRGWSDRDAWDTGTSIVENIIEMLEYMRNNLHSHPIDFSSADEWSKWIFDEIILPLLHSREEQQVQINEYESLILYNKATEEEQKLWFEREKEILAWRQSELERGLRNFALRKDDLWD